MVGVGMGFGGAVPTQPIIIAFTNDSHLCRLERYVIELREICSLWCIVTGCTVLYYGGS